MKHNSTNDFGYTVFSSESSFDGTRAEVDDYRQALRKKEKNWMVGKTIDTTKDFKCNVEKFYH